MGSARWQAGGGDIVRCDPATLVDWEVGADRPDDLIVTETMHERVLSC
jgi:hypothetical protein